jgi:hypothetical protein
MIRVNVSALWLVLAAAACGDDSSAAAGANGGSGAGGAGVGAAGAGGTGVGAAGAGGAGAEGGGGAGGTPNTGVCGPGLYHPTKNVYWGDLHVHTSYSIDSFVFGNRNDPAAAYAFARGDGPAAIDAGSGGLEVATLEAPLDFAAVTDHSEFLSVTAQCQLGAAGNEDLCANLNNQGSTEQGTNLVLLLARLAATDPPPLPGCVTPQNAAQCAAALSSAWVKVQEAAAAANAPCSFTSLIAYEWTATTGAANLHRNVIFSSDNVPAVPFDYIAYPTAVELWQALDANCKPELGCDALTIPHNSNLSNGLMFDTADDPDPITREYMSRYQRLVEIYQHKGASECAPGGALSDPECSFEDADDSDPATSAPGYVRNALGRGLMLQESDGANPLQMGIIGATDTHNGVPGYVQESDWKGHAASTDAAVSDRLDAINFGPGAITGVWAHENTREEIFSALQRRETYATSGPRIPVRFFALDGVADGAAEAFCRDPEFPKALLEAGAATMGADVIGMSNPTLFVAATSAGTPLDRLDIVRVGLDNLGEPQVALETTQLSGADQATFCRTWKAPAFTPGVPSLYYVRLLEQPTPRWSALDCQVQPNHPSCTDPTIPTTIRERAWTSPIFFRPQG